MMIEAMMMMMLMLLAAAVAVDDADAVDLPQPKVVAARRDSAGTCASACINNAAAPSPQ